MGNLFSVRTNYWKNGTQWMGRWTARLIGENHYELARIEKRIFYARFYYFKQAILGQMSLETPDVVNAFSVLAKEDTSHGFPVWRPLERNSDFALYNVNSEGWFQMWSVIAAFVVVSFWFYIADFYFAVVSTSVDEEDNLRLKDAKAGLIWERNFWAMTFQIHGQHMSALQREIKFYTHHPDDPKLTVKSSYNVKNPYAPDRYYKGWGKMTDMRIM
jgi:hypothetical protein